MKGIFNVYKRDHLYLDICARGYPEPKYNLTYVKNHREISLEDMNDFDGMITSRIPLTVLKVPTALSLVACNTNGCINDTIHSIHVTGNRIVLEQTPGQAIHLCCENELRSAWNVTWFFNTSRETRISEVTQLPSGFYSNYKIPKISYLDEGFYECRTVQNSKWITIGDFHLKIKDDATPATLAAEHDPSSTYQITNNDDMIMKILITALGMILIIAVICGILFFCKYKKEMKQKDTEIAEMTQLVKKIVVQKQINIDDNFPDVLNMPVVSIERLKCGIVKNGMVSVGEYEMSLDEHWEYPRQNLRLGETLGEGEFGKVVQAEAKDIWEHGNDLVTVAVKMLKDDHMDSDMIDLVSEMELMKLLGSHQNILRLLGCCSQGGPLLVITEYARNGNLKNFLRKHHHHSIKIEESTLLTYARQIAQGMVHLSSIKCIHRDLAARNILVTAQCTMKIADFGLARDVRHTEYYKKTSNGRLPIKWMAPEGLFHNKYTMQSDVWSFGILLWEIITLGDDPYHSIDSLAGLRNALKQNYRMEKPANASTNIYKLMMDCWSFWPEDRPNFSSIVERLKELLIDARPKVVDGLYHSENSDEFDSQSVISTTESSEDENEIRKPILK
ncbi:fibroblast growth factor receptor 2-like [Planococcus citri]|uniref:fibroblast growth factor receptor 2-like n=1 Tax=Planococcus citri TaxID=170843 RepID=UPI0031FA22B1